MTNNTKGILYACTTALLWGVLAIALKVALLYFDSISIVWFRFTLSSLMLLIYFSVKERSAFGIFKNFPYFVLLAGFFLGCNYFGFMMGLDRTSPSTTQVVIQIGPILLGILGIFLFKETINKYQLGGFALAAMGLFLFYYNQLEAFSDTGTYNQGFLWILFAALTWTAYAIVQKKLVQKHNPQMLNMFIYAVPALMFLPAADFGVFVGISPGKWLLLILLGINTLVAYGCIAMAFKYTDAYKVSIIVTLNPIITLVLMTLLYYIKVDWLEGEKLSLLSSVGALMLIGGAIIAVFFSRLNKKDHSVE